MSETPLSQLALDLTKDFPASPREKLADYVIAKRMLDKCRATLAGKQGEYKFDCVLDNCFFSFTEIGAEAFKSFVATGASDEEVAAWIQERAKKRDREEIIAWNNQMRATRVCDLPIDRQVFLEDYIPQHLPKGRVVYVWFDIYDIEEGRI